MQLARLAEPLQRICADADVAFIVNDSMALAKRLGADGVHLGQSDGDIREARALLGPTPRSARPATTAAISRWKRAKPARIMSRSALSIRPRPSRRTIGPNPRS